MGATGLATARTRAVTRLAQDAAGEQPAGCSQAPGQGEQDKQKGEKKGVMLAHLKKNAQLCGGQRPTRDRLGMHRNGGWADARPLFLCPRLSALFPPSPRWGKWTKSLFARS